MEITQESSSGGRGGTSRNRAASGMQQTRGQKMRCQKDGKYKRHRLPWYFLAPGDKKQKRSKIKILNESQGYGEDSSPMGSPLTPHKFSTRRWVCYPARNVAWSSTLRGQPSGGLPRKEQVQQAQGLSL